MSHHLVEARGLSFAYPDGTPALRDVSCRFTHGESVGIVGATTIFKGPSARPFKHWRVPSIC